MQVKGSPKVVENWEGNWGTEYAGSQAGKSGSNTRKEEREAGGEADWRKASGRGSLAGGDRKGALGEREAGKGTQVLVT